MKSRAEIEEKVNKRISFAANRGVELGTSIRDWAIKYPVDLESSLAENKLSWKAVLKFTKAPDLDDWNHIFGDSIHNMRSALNNMLAEIAIAEGLSMKDARDIQFPIVNDRSQWPSQLRWIRKLPESVQVAVEQLQPYHRPEFDGNSPAQDPLAILSALSNQDKHRLELVPSMEVMHIAHDYTIQFEDEPREDLPDVMNRMVIDGRFESEVEVISHDTSPYRIEKILGHSKWHGRAVITTDTDITYSPADVLQTLVPYVSEVVHYVLDAWEADKDQGN